MACIIDGFKEFYVDIVAGDNNNSGESEAEAWKTLEYALAQIRAKSLSYGGYIALWMGTGVYNVGVFPDTNEGVFNNLKSLDLRTKYSNVVINYDQYAIFNSYINFLGVSINFTGTSLENPNCNCSINQSEIGFISINNTLLVNIGGTLDFLMSDIYLGASIKYSQIGIGGSGIVYINNNNNNIDFVMNIGSGSKIFIGQDNIQVTGSTTRTFRYNETNDSTGSVYAYGRLLPVTDPITAYDVNNHETNIGYYQSNSNFIMTPGVDVMQDGSGPVADTVPVLVNDGGVWKIQYRPFQFSSNNIIKAGSVLFGADAKLIVGVINLEMLKIGSKYYGRIASFTVKYNGITGAPWSVAFREVRSINNNLNENKWITYWKPAIQALSGGKYYLPGGEIWSYNHFNEPQFLMCVEFGSWNERGYMTQLNSYYQENQVYCSDWSSYQNYNGWVEWIELVNYVP